MVNVVFLGGPLDGLERVVPDEARVVRFPQLVDDRALVDPWAKETPHFHYVEYRRTRRTIRDCTVYSFVHANARA